MHELPGKIAMLESDFRAVINTLDEVNDENFDQKFERLQFLQDKISTERKSLLDQYDPNILKDYNIKLKEYIKEISKRFDNITRRNIEEQRKVKNELNVTLNSRKLLNYQR